MFPAGVFHERRLKLVRQHTYPSGVVELRYERATAGARAAADDETGRFADAI
jgi:hypothetical protein